MQRTVARRVVAKSTDLLVLIGLTIVTAYSPAERPAEDRPGQFHVHRKRLVPTGIREWSHVGTRANSGGINILNGLPIKAPEILNAYVEPSAMAAFEKTGK